MSKFVSTEGGQSGAHGVLASESDRPDSTSPRSAARHAVAAAILSSLTGFVSPAHAQFTVGSGVATGSNSVAIDGVLAGGTGATASATDAIAIGTGAQATNTEDVAIGPGAIAGVSGGDIRNTAIGSHATATGGQSTAIGDFSSATGNFGVASGEGSGEGSVASGLGSSAYGTGSTASGVLSTAIGEGSTASGANAYAGGNFATASGASSVALGVSSTAQGGGSIALGNGAVPVSRVRGRLRQTTLRSARVRALQRGRPWPWAQTPPRRPPAAWH
jgi:hypothetical protein